MFTRKSIVINMHKRVMFFSFFVFTLNDFKQKTKVKEIKLLLRQRFNNNV